MMSEVESIADNLQIVMPTDIRHCVIAPILETDGESGLKKFDLARLFVQRV